jgi:hypothetical protein
MRENRVQRKPTFDLTRLAAAAREGRVALGKKRARETLLPLLGELLACDEFACAVVLALQPTDFNVTKNLEGVLYDEYGIRLSDELMEQFGLSIETWYLKITVREVGWGDEVFCLSLHPLEEQMNCVGGRLVPTTRDEP